MASTDFPQRGQTPVSRVSASSIGLTRPAAPGDPAEADAASAPVTGWPAVRWPVRAAETVNGLPQSMQNRELGSFSRPQKVQMRGGVTRG